MSRTYSNPEPPPHAGKVAVWPLVIEDVCASMIGSSSLRERFCKEAQQRDASGREKYGTTLQTHNGRNPLVDAFQESMDMTVYLRQAVEEGYPVGYLYRTAISHAQAILATLIANGL